jgi:hypothetical protein
MLTCFEIVLLPFQLTDGANVKPRPAMVNCLSERHQDVLLAFISLPADLRPAYVQTLRKIVGVDA